MGNDPLTRQFALESQTRAIDHCTDIDELRSLAKRLLSAWYMQSDMTREFGAQALGMGLGIGRQPGNTAGNPL
ncbi:MAG: hypothetical protein ACK522_02280 [Synechococcaceae cyanobacterium]|jgi:hypothetical protein